MSALGRALCAVMILGIEGAALFVALDSYRVPGDGPYDHYFAALVLALTGLSFWRASFYPQIEIDARGLSVRNPLRTRHIAWDEVRDVSPGYAGMNIQLRDGRSVVAWAVQEANIAAWLKRPTRSKTIAQEIMNIAASQNAQGHPASR